MSKKVVNDKKAFTTFYLKQFLNNLEKFLNKTRRKRIHIRKK